jgi:hypothetical protein
MADWGLIRGVLGDARFVPLDEAAFLRLNICRRNALTALGIEEKHDMFLANMLELETETLGVVARRIYSDHRNWNNSIEDLHLLNRRIVNLLTSCRMYADQLLHDTSGIYGKESAIYRQIKGFLSHEYDKRLGYRFMEALRNHVQHCGLPAHKISTGRGIVGDKHGPNVPIQRFASVHAMIADLRENGSFKISILNEVSHSGAESVDLIEMARDYVAGLSTVHHRVRSCMTTEVNGWVSAVRSAIFEFHGHHDENLSVRLVARDDDGLHLEAHTLFLDFENRREYLVQRHSAVHTSTRDIITSRKID